MAARNGSRAWVGETLRDLRKAAGLTGIGTAKKIGIAQSRMSRIELGRLLATADEIKALCRIYRAPSEIRSDLLRAEKDLRAQTIPARAIISSGQGWKMQERIKHVEEGSAEVWYYQPAMIVGLVQTPEYATAVWGGDVSDDAGRRWLAERMDRQKVLGSEKTQVTILMAEGALRWQGGSAQVMRGQLARLVDEIRSRPGLRLGIIPQYRPTEVFTTHGFSVFDQRTVIVGVKTGTSFIADADQVTTYVDLFRELEKLAVYGDEAIAVIESVAGAYG